MRATAWLRSTHSQALLLQSVSVIMPLTSQGGDSSNVVHAHLWPAIAVGEQELDGDDVCRAVLVVKREIGCPALCWPMMSRSVVRTNTPQH
jgi:hypothetical protein